jgi:peptidoglycan hydrolase-like protein with peptidoglycan-binding domain
VTRRATSTPAYIEPKRQIAVAPLIGVAVLAALGAGVWLLDPMGMRGDKAEAGQASASEAAVAAPAPSPEAESDWAQIDRNDPASLRAYLTAHPQSTGAESARSLLRVLDAQAWVEAVTADTEDAYTAYLRDFPASAATPGAMADAANDRLESLGNERSQAVGDIQRGLAALKLYSGQVDGKPNDALVKAMATYAARKKQRAPSLTEAAPRDLRAFADVLAASGASASAKSEAAAKAAEAAAEADARRVEAAEAARVEARRDAPPVAASSSPSASGQSAPDRAADDEAWKTAQAAGTIASYQAYIAAQPEGLRVFEAKTQIARLSRPAPYSPQLVAAGLRPALEMARRAQATAATHAASAREMAKRADDAAALARAGAGDARTVTAADGTRYEAEIVDGKPNGVGVRISGAVATRGDRYRGQLRNGLGAGPGVYEFADNPNNAQAGALRYEGDHAGDFPTGYGVTTWKNGDVFAAQITDAAGASTGVLTFANGQRYEGQMVNGVRQGLGVVWSATGEPLLAGRWERGELVEPMAAPATAP